VYKVLNLKSLYRFHQQPFVLLFSGFAAGILVSGNLNIFLNVPFFGLILLVLFLGLEVSGRLKSWMFTIFLIISVFLLGAWLVQSRSSPTAFSLSEISNSADPVLGVKLEEVSESQSDWLKCVGELKKIYTLDTVHEVSAQILFFIKKSEYQLMKGDHLLVASQIEPIKNKGNPGEFDAEKYWRGKGIRFLSFVNEHQYRLLDHEEPQFFEQYTDQIRTYCKKVLDDNFSGQEGAVLSAIVLGDKSMLSTETRNSFMNTGAMHVLAVSGLHIGLILYLLLFVTERFSRFVSRKTALICILLFLWIYAAVTGMSPSVIRAVFMFSMLSLSQLLSRDYNPINILFFTAFCLLVYDPLYIYDIGFQLSYLAMLGIFLFYEKIENSFSIKNSLLKKIWQGTAIGLAAQIMTTPLSLYYFHQFPNYFILSNLGLMATSGLILGLGIAVIALAKLPFVLKPVVLLLWATLFVTLRFLSQVEQLPGAVAYGYDLNIWQGILILVAAFLLFFAHSFRTKIVIAVPMILVAASWISAERFQKMSTDEITVFAHSKPLISLKKGGRIYCFYKASNAKDLEKANMIMEAYSKVRPGKLIMQEIGDSVLKLKDEKIEFKLIPEKDNFCLSVNNRDYSIVMKNGVEAKDFLTSFRIGMPWVDGVLDHSLRNGAFKIDL
jgi:competence protein ComEC